MNDRWQKVEQLYNDALERDEAERDAYLRDACGGDDALRREEESLLRNEKKAGRFLDTPAVEVAAKLFDQDSGQSMIGRRT